MRSSMKFVLTVKVYMENTVWEIGDPYTTRFSAPTVIAFSSQGGTDGGMFLAMLIF